MLAILPFIHLAIEANEVIGLRILSITSGKTAAFTEIQLMIAEKLDAGAEAGRSLISGQSATSVIERYRELVASNRRRLSA